MRPALPLLALVLLSVGALAFDLTTASRLPTTADWAEAAAALRARARPGDAVQLWPPWLERARLVVDAAEVLAEEDLEQADYPGLRRLWLLALPGPFAKVIESTSQLAARGAVPEGERLQFGPLRLQAWDLRAPPLAGDLLAHGPFVGAWPEFHEVQYVSRRCRLLPIGTPSQPALVGVRGAAGARLQLRAGIVGERAYDFRSTVRVELLEGSSAGPLPAAPLASIEVPGTVDPAPAWLAAAAAPAPGPDDRDFTLRISTAGDQRPPLCVALWSTR